MATKDMTAAQIAKAWRSLRDDSTWATMKQKIRRRHALHEGTDLPTLPDHMTSTGYSYVITKRLSALARDLMAFLSSYPTTTTAYANKREHAHRADEAEKRLAVLRANLFEDVRGEMRWHQLVTGYGVYKLNCFDSGAIPQWGVEVIDVDSISFPNPASLPNRPKRAAREYTMTAAELSARYGADRALQPEHQGSRLKNNAGVWGFEPISRAVATDEGSSEADAEADDFGPVTVIEYSTESCTYICVKNKLKDGGQPSNEYTKVWQYEHLFKGTPYVVVPGYVTGSSAVHERILPYLNAVINVLYQINFIRTALMTSWTSARFQVAVEGDPDLLNAAESLGIATPASPEQIQTGRDVIYFAGKPYFYSPPAPEVAKILLEDAMAEYNELASSELSVTTAEVTSQATRGGQQLAVGQREKQKTDLLKYEDRAEQMILEMVVETITADGGYEPDDAEGWGYFAPSSGARYKKGEVEAGTRVYFDKETFDFPFTISVTTASKTEDDRARDTAAKLQEYAANAAYFDEVLDAKGIQDIDDWYERKAEDDGYKMIASAMGPNVVLSTFQKRLALRAGIMLQIPGLMPDVGMTAPTGVGGGAPPPQTEGVGGSPPQPVTM
jgi:hypothetical protein